MALDLVARGDDAGGLDDALDVLDREVGDADGFHFAGFFDFDERFPGLDEREVVGDDYFFLAL